jgi:hypothetical protein
LHDPKKNIICGKIVHQSQLQKVFAPRILVSIEAALNLKCYAFRQKPSLKFNWTSQLYCVKRRKNLRTGFAIKKVDNDFSIYLLAIAFPAEALGIMVPASALAL